MMMRYSLVIGALGLLASLGVIASSPQTAQAACSGSYGSDTIHVTAPTSTTYVVWTRIKTPSSSPSGGIMLQVDGGTCYNVGGRQLSPENWTWVNYTNGSTSSVLNVSLSTGAHTLTYVGSTARVGVDAVLLLASNNSCVPSGNGSNCAPPPPTPTPTPTPISSGGGGGGGGSSSGSGSGIGNVPVVSSTSGGSVTAQGGAVELEAGSGSADNPVVKALYFLNGKLVATETQPPFSYRLDTHNLLNGTYQLKTVQFFKDGTTQTAVKNLVVANPPSFTQLVLAAHKYGWWWALGLLVVILIGFGLLIYIRKQRLPATAYAE